VQLSRARPHRSGVDRRTEANAKVERKLDALLIGIALNVQSQTAALMLKRRVPP
jgi:hypothetical protein